MSHFLPHGRSWYSCLDARVKIVGTILIVVVFALLTEPSLIIVGLGAAIVLAVASRVDYRTLAKAYLLALPFIGVAAASALLYGGWTRGLELSARISSCTIPLLVLSQGTDSFSLSAGLTRLGIPRMITTLLILTQRYIQVLSDESSRMRLARRARGFHGGRSLLEGRSLRIIADTAGMVLARSLRRGDRVYEGLKLRGYSDGFGPLMASKLRGADIAFASILVSFSVSLGAAQLGVIP